MSESDPPPDHVEPGVPVASTGNAALVRRQEAELQRLVQRMAAHEEAALGELYDLTSGLIYALAMRMLRKPEDAEEATLDAYTRAWKKASSYNPSRGSVTAWLVIMVRSIAIDRIRAGATQADKTAPLSDPAVPASDENGPEASAWLGQQRRRVLEALDKLPVDQRRAIELAFYSGMSHTELAEATGVPLGTVKTRVRLGMKRLRELLDDLT
jgi:RNA polymerase sigma-70 factor (ECF subfamily)